MRVGCDDRHDAEELLRAVLSWLKDTNVVVPDGARDATIDLLAAARIELAGVKETRRRR